MSPSPQRHPRRHLLAVTPAVSRVLAVVSIDALWAWFFLKFFINEESTGLSLVVGSLAILGAGGCLALYASVHFFLATAADADLDERELWQRNRAYRSTLLYVLAMLLLAYIGAEALQVRTPQRLSPGVISNFLTVAFLTTLAFPAAALAWWDRAEPE